MAGGLKKPDPEDIVRVKHLPTLIKGLVASIGGYSNGRLEAAIAPLVARIEALEAAVPEYVGTFEIGREYRRNQLCTHSGSMWIALRTTATQPPSDDWQLCVKRGRDGRDAARLIEAPQRLQ